MRLLPAAVCLLLLSEVFLSAQETAPADLAPQFLSEQTWALAEPAGSWKTVSKSEDSRIFETTGPGRVFGMETQQIQAYYKKEKLSEIQITYLEAGNFFGQDAGNSKKAQKQFSAMLKQAEDRLDAELTRQFGKGRRVSVGSSQRLRSRVTEYSAGSLVIRLYSEEDQLLSVAILSADSASRKILAAAPDQNARRKETAENVQKLPNGDVIIDNIPMIEQGDRGYCAMGTLAMVMRYYGLSLNIDLIAAKAGYRQGDVSNASIIPTYQACAREGKLKLRVDDKFDFKKAQKNILKGYPMIAARQFDRVRDTFHTEFARRYALDPQAILPKPDRQERQRWPGKTGSNHASLITGFNETRKEILFTESWGERMRNRRMLAEEMEATAWEVYYFTPP
jgi:hypothetical protein